jgi:hypothetical protein
MSAVHKGVDGRHAYIYCCMYHKGDNLGMIFWYGGCQWSAYEDCDIVIYSLAWAPDDLHGSACEWMVPGTYQDDL